MKRAIQIAVLFGIPVRLHWSFFLLLAYIVFAGQARSGDWHYALWGLFFFLMLFACVVLHEFGHALTARRYGVVTRDIILSPIGGIARLSKLPEHPWQEFLVAIAGPLVNIAIALVLLLVVSWVNWESLLQLLQLLLPQADYGVESQPFAWSRHFLPALLTLNLALAIFNLLPAFPMDGGRILRALLATRLPRLRATRIASLTGQTLAVLLALYGSYSLNFVMALIGVFVFFSASREYQYARMEAKLAKVQVREVLLTDFPLLTSQSTVQNLREIIQNTPYRNFLVFDPEQEAPTLLGILSEEHYRKKLPKAQGNTPIAPWVQSDYERTTPEATLKDAYERMQAQKAPVLPVFTNGKLVGMIDANHAGHYVEQHT